MAAGRAKQTIRRPDGLVQARAFAVPTPASEGTWPTANPKPDLSPSQTMVVWVNAGWFRPQAIAESADLQTISDQQAVVPLLLLFLAARRSDLLALPRPPESVGNRPATAFRRDRRVAGEGQVQALADRITEMAMAAIASEGAPASTDGDVSAGKNKIEAN